MSKCVWKESENKTATSVIVFECSVCSRRIGLSLEELNTVFHGNTQELFDKQPDCKGMEAKEEHTRKYDESCNKEKGITWDKTKRWLEAVKKWTLAGFPTRSLEEIEDIYNNKCIVCDNILKLTGSCRLCGCKVSKLRIALLNKIRMGTEHCPIKKW
jgi:hypothetical protein